MYLVDNTVEEAIYDISVASRLEHMNSASKSADASASTSRAVTPMAAEEKSLEKANSAEMEAVPLQQLLSKGGGGEAVQNDDLWQCLFGRPRRVGKEGMVREEEPMSLVAGL